MALPVVELPYSDRSISVDIGTDLLIPPLTLPPPLDNIKSVLSSSVRNPVGSAPLQELIPDDGTISILVPDITRGTSLKEILPLVIEELDDYGVERGRIEILVANGAHRIEDEDELRSHLGSEIMDAFSIYQHEADSPGAHLRIGSTASNSDLHLDGHLVRSDMLIPVSSISFHYFAGFGGGRKMIMPGMASRESILRNHRLSLRSDPSRGISQGCYAGNLDGNPVHADMVSAVEQLDNRIFMINTVTDPDGRILFINSGDIFDSHLEGCEYMRRAFSIRLERKFSTVLLSCGGSPKDINLLQAHKALRYGAAAAEKGADIYFAAACSEGIGSESYLKSAGLEEFGEKEYSLNMQTAVSTRELASDYNIHLKSELDRTLVERFGFIHWDGRKIDAENGTVLVLRNGSYFLPVTGILPQDESGDCR